MSQLLTQLTFRLTAAAAVGFYYLAAAPPASAQVKVCGPGNYSDACTLDSQTTAQPTEKISNVYSRNYNQAPSTAVPEPSTAIALLMTGVGIVYSAKKRKQIGGER